MAAIWLESRTPLMTSSCGKYRHDSQSWHWYALGFHNTCYLECSVTNSFEISSVWFDYLMSLISGFKCSLGEPKVLHLDLLCDGVKHCLSGIDESHCGPSTRRAEWGYVKDDREQCAELRGVGQRATHKDTHRQGCVVRTTCLDVLLEQTSMQESTFSWRNVSSELQETLVSTFSTKLSFAESKRLFSEHHQPMFIHINGPFTSLVSNEITFWRN